MDDFICAGVAIAVAIAIAERIMARTNNKCPETNERNRLSEKVPIAHALTSLLCIALRSAIHEWPQTVRGPVEHCFGFVCQVFGLRIIRKLVGIVSGCFDYHAATLQNDFGRSISLNCAIRNKRWTTGEGRVSFFTYL